MSKELVGLYLKNDGWSLSHMSEDAKTVLHFHEAEWRFAELDERATELRSYWQEHRLPKQVMVAIQDPEALWTILELPPVVEKEMSLAVRNSLEDLLPPDGTSLWVYSVLEQGEKVKVLAGAVQAALVNAWVALLEEVGITPLGFVLTSQALVSAVIQGEEPTAFVMVDEAWTTIGVTEHDIPVFFRTFATPKSTEELTKKIRQESLVTRHAWQRHDGVSPQKIFILTTSQKLSKDDFEGIWGLSNEQIQVSQGFATNTLSLIVAKGAAIIGLKGSELVIQPKLPVKERRELIQVVLTVAASVVLLGVGIGLFYRAEQTRQQYQAAWIKDNAVLCRELARLEQQDSKVHLQIENYSKYWSKRRCYLEFFEQWQNIVPEQTILTGLTLDGPRVVDLSGQTPSFVQFFTAVNKSGIFKDVKIKGSITHNPNGYDEFHLSGELKEEVIDGENTSGK